MKHKETHKRYLKRKMSNEATPKASKEKENTATTIFQGDSEQNASSQRFVDKRRGQQVFEQ